MSHPKPYDAVILGAGAAGFTAAIYLGRYLRPTLILNERKPHTRWHRPTAHNVLGFPSGIQRTQLLDWGKLHAEKYDSVHYQHASIVSIRRDDGLFVLADDEGKTYRALGLIIAPGVEHLLPDVPNVFDYAGYSIWHCPECDGYAARGKRIVVIGRGRGTAGFALGCRVWTSRLTICTDGCDPDFDDECSAKLREQNIAIHPGKMAQLSGDPAHGILEKIILEDGTELPCDGAFCNLGEVPPTELLRQLPLDLFKDRYVNVDHRQRTNIPLCYAAGDICSHSQTQLSVAMGQGATAAISLHKELLPACYRVDERS